MLMRFCDEFEKRGAKIDEELTWQMGRPARYAPNEVRGTLERARHMIAIAPEALKVRVRKLLIHRMAAGLEGRSPKKVAQRSS